MRFKLKTLTTSVAVGLLCVSMSIKADVRDVFDRYTSSSPGAYTNSDGSRTFYGGSFRAQIDQNPVQLLGFSAPKISAGCGGIDMYAGSFSLVSGDEVVQMLRGVAQGVPAYFFQLALSNICSKCENLMAAINEQIRELNKWGRLSCEEAGNAILNSDALAPMVNSMRQSEIPALNAEDGLIDSWATSLKELDWGPGNDNEFNTPNTRLEEFSLGNLLAHLVKEMTVSGYRFIPMGSNEETNKVLVVEYLTSLLGKTQIHVMENGKSKADSVPSTITVKDLFPMEGDLDAIKLVRCSGSGATVADKCETMTNPQTYAAGSVKYETMVGLIPKMQKIISNDDAGDLGIIQRLREKIPFEAKHTKLMLLARYNFVGIAVSKRTISDIRLNYVYHDIKASILYDYNREMLNMLSALAAVAKRTKGEVDNAMVEAMTIEYRAQFRDAINELDAELEKAQANALAIEQAEAAKGEKPIKT